LDYGQLCLRSVNQAPLGCDFDFLRGNDPAGPVWLPKFNLRRLTLPAVMRI